MSLNNNPTNANNQINMPRFATHPQLGQFIMFTANQNQPGVTYSLAPYINGQHGLQLQHQLPRFVTNQAGQHFRVFPTQQQHHLTQIHQLQSNQQHQIQANQISQHQLALQFQQPALPAPSTPKITTTTTTTTSNATSTKSTATITHRQQQQQTHHTKVATKVDLPTNLKDNTNASIKVVKEKCIGHYIEGELLIETSKSFDELKVKIPRKKEKKRQNQQHFFNKQHIPKKEQPLELPQSQIKAIGLGNPSLGSPQLASSSETSRYVSNNKQTEHTNEIESIRAAMPSWSVDDVVNFIETHEDIRQYSSKFADDEMDGKALQLMIDRNLDLPMLASMFKHGPALKIQAALQKYKLKE